jgi:hypothetical protein
MAVTTPTGIPTTYRHTNFRSRLEARWAAFMDLIEWSWVYEPLDVAGYIPDFLVQGQHPFFVEVGPCISVQDYRDKSAKADAAALELATDLLVVGVDPLSPCDDDRLSAGLLGEFGEWLSDDPATLRTGFSWGAGLWGMGTTGTGIYHSLQWFGHRPHGDGQETPLTNSSLIMACWAEAGNAVQWKRR